jgi:MFS family permease
MALFSMMTFIGPGLGPVVSGFLQLTEDWRWSFYVLLWLAAGTLPFMFTIPETLPSQVLLNKAKRIRRAKIPGYENVMAPVEATDRSLKGIFSVALTRPWKILFDPISLFCAIYLSVVYTLLYMLFSIYPFVFQTKRGWNPGVGELPLIGTVVGACFGGAYVFYVSAQDKKKILAGQTRRPEDRLIVAMVGGVIFPLSMFGLAWSGNYNSVHWIVPTIFGTILASSILLVFVAYLNYITDSYLMYAASALAANTICRSAAGSAAPLFTDYMFTAMGVGGAGSLIAGVACLLAPIPFVFYRYGEPIRKRSKFAPTDQAPDAEKPKDDEDNKGGRARNGSTSGESTDKEELALDEEQGVPEPTELREEIEKERNAEGSHLHNSESGDRFIDASGMEKAEN